MPNTIKSVCDEVIKKLCNVPIQNFEAAATIREMQRLIDPKGTKKLNRDQVKATKAFLNFLGKFEKRTYK
jgi:hypothetical protein